MKKVLISSFTFVLSLMIIVSSISVSANWDTSQIVFPETVATYTGGWGAGASNPSIATDKKSFTLTAKETSSGYTQQIQCLVNIGNFSSVLSSAKKIAFDFYPSFLNQNDDKYCWLKYSFDDQTWSGEYSNGLKNNEKYTLIINSSDIASTAKFIHMQFQNYGSPISSDSVMIVSAPYVYEAGQSEPTSNSGEDNTTNGETPSTQSGSGFDPEQITFPETVASLVKGWEADCSLIVALNKKYCTFTPYSASASYIPQFQGYLNISNFSNLFSSTSQIAFDIYPTFSNESAYDKKCYVKYSFDQNTYSGDYANALESGKKYTMVINSSDIPSNAKAIHMVFQNYGSKISTADADIIVSAPYAYGTQTNTQPSSEVTTPSSNDPTTPASNDSFPALDTSKAFFKINNVKGTAGEEVEVPITIGNNPGIFLAKLNIAFDSTLLTFKDVKPGDVFTADEIYYGNTQANVLNIAFESSDLVNNNSKNGTIAKIVFKINSNSEQTATTLNFTDYKESNYISCTAENVPFTFGNGIVSIAKKAPSLAAPTNVKVKLNSNKKSTVTWNAISEAKGYEVYRQENSGSFKSVKTIVDGSTKFVDSSLKAGKKYTYKVRAFSSTLVSAFSANSNTVKTYKLAQVKSLKVKVSGKKVTFSWKKVSNAQKYEIYVSTKKVSGYKKIKTLKAKKFTAKLKSNKKYFVKVRALRKVVKSNVCGKYSTTKPFKTK